MKIHIPAYISPWYYYFYETNLNWNNVKKKCIWSTVIARHYQPRLIERFWSLATARWITRSRASPSRPSCRFSFLFFFFFLLRFNGHATTVVLFLCLFCNSISWMCWPRRGRHRIVRDGLLCATELDRRVSRPHVVESLDTSPSLRFFANHRAARSIVLVVIF